MLAIFWAIVAAAPAGAAPLLTVAQGRLVGISNGSIESFRNIPYAAPPVGALRWRAPQPAAAWQDTRAADAFGPECIQPLRHGSANAAVPQSEDCLTLNVWRPARAHRALPVMVWIHGGGLVGGSGREPTFDGSAFARRGVILVTINYRLGQFGFFVHPALVRENADGGKFNNYGLMDQVAALRWVRDNIGAFGGDPARVTIFGESAGGQSVDALMLMPMARGLFSAAISQSGWGRGSFARIDSRAPDGKPPAEDAGIALMRRLGIGPEADAAALRRVTAASIRDASTFDVPFGFVVDGRTVMEDLWNGFRKGHEAPVPFLIGSTDHEEPLDIDSSPMAVITLPYLHRGEMAGLEQAYGGASEVQAHVVGDVVFVSQARSLALLHRRNGYPTFLYRFAGVPEGSPKRAAGAPHGSELPYVFNTLGTAPYATGTSDRALAATMNAHWAEFAVAGRPGGGWSRYDGTSVMTFGNAASGLRPDPWNARFDVLEAIAGPRS